MQNTTDVVKAFVNLAAQSDSSPLDNPLRKRCQEVETEVRYAMLYCVAMLAYHGHSALLYDQSYP